MPPESLEVVDGATALRRVEELFRDLLAAVEAQTDTSRRIEQQLAQLLRSREPARDERHASLIAALAAIGDCYDLSFSAAEVIRHSHVDHNLAEALAAVGAHDADQLGLIFRALKGRDFGGVTLIRDRRVWRLARTSCM